MCLSSSSICTIVILDIYTQRVADPQISGHFRCWKTPDFCPVDDRMAESDSSNSHRSSHHLLELSVVIWPVILSLNNNPMIFSSYHNQAALCQSRQPGSFSRSWYGGCRGRSLIIKTARADRCTGCLTVLDIYPITLYQRVCV